MNKRNFLKISSSLFAAPLFSPLLHRIQNQPFTNWAGNLTYGTTNIEYPATVEAIQLLVKKYSKLKVLGTRHCFNTIADSKDRFISLRDMNKIVGLDVQAQTVTVEAGIKYGELAPWLTEKGYALHNLASLPHISVAGAVTTATHGSGVKNGNLSSAVEALELVKADGSILHLSSKDGDHFHAAVVGLGAFGVLTKITLKVQPTYKMRQYVYEQLPIAELRKNFDAIMGTGYSVSLFTDWTKETINEVWVKSREADVTNKTAQPDFYGAKAATDNVHPIIELSAENCTEQLGVPGHWYERLPHFKMGFTPSSGKELQAEYFVPHSQAVDAILAIQKMGKTISPHLMISEIRTIAADDWWLSPCYRQPCVAIHFTLKQETDAVMKLLPQIEKALAPYHAKPHWGKLFTMPAARLASLYSKMNDFKKLVAEYDPQQKFRNAFLERNFGQQVKPSNS
jgi:xylitol oxidase